MAANASDTASSTESERPSARRVIESVLPQSRAKLGLDVGSRSFRVALELQVKVLNEELRLAEEVPG